MSPDLPPLAQRELDAVDAALEGRPVEADLADVAELARALQAERPVPSPTFARELDERAARGWQRRPNPARPRRRPRLAALLRPQLGIAVAGLAALALGIAVLPDMLATTYSSSEDGGGSVQITASDPPPEVDVQRSGAESAAGRPLPAPAGDLAGSGSSLAPPPAAELRRDGGDRQVERSAAMTLATKPDELESVAAGVARVTERADGYVAESSVTAAPESGSAEFTLRVPSARLGAVLSDLSKLADVRSRTQAADDITAAVTSTSERVADLRAERRGLRRKLARTGEEAVRDRLEYVTGQLARARADLRTVRRRADLATVQVSLTGDPEAGTGAAADDGRWGPADAVRDAGRILEWVASAALVVLAAAVPLLLILLPLLLLARWRRGQLRERTLDAV